MTRITPMVSLWARTRLIYFFIGIGGLIIIIANMVMAAMTWGRLGSSGGTREA